MTDGSPDARGDKTDDKVQDASPAASPAADSAALARGTDELAAPSSGTEPRDSATSDVGEGIGGDGGDDDDDEVDEDEEEEEDEEEDEEPKLKYARLTPHLGAVYRNGDATSSFLVAGDKMIIGSHNGNIVSKHTPPQPVTPVNFSVARYTTALVPVVTSLPCPLSFRDLHLDISVPSSPFFEAET